MKRLILSAMVVGIVGLAVMSVLWIGTRRSSANAPESTMDIGAKFDPATRNDFFTAAAFAPQLSANSAIAKATAYLKERNNWDAVALKLPVRSTVGLFTGQSEETNSWVSNLKVRVVVFDKVPLPNSGPVRPNAGSTTTGITRATMVLDDATGGFVYGTLWGSDN